MGIEYYIVDRQKQIFYELGKGGWYALNDDLEAVQDLEYLIDYLLYDCCGFEEGKAKPDWVEYISTRIAPEIYTHFHDSDPKHLFVINDCDDNYFEIRCRNYRCIGSRFYEHESAEYQKNMCHLNRHLTSDRPKWFNMPLRANSKWARPEE